jgi:hypothetical protein
MPCTHSFVDASVPMRNTLSSRVQPAGDRGSGNSDTNLPTARHHIPAHNLNIQCHTHPTTPTLLEEHRMNVSENRLEDILL